MQGTAKYQRLNNVGREVYNERGDCSVIAVAVFCDVSYGKARAALARAGRKHRRGATTPMIVKAVEELKGEGSVRLIDMPNVTVKKVADLLKTDAVLLTRNHACSMMSGIVHDWTQGRRHIVRRAIVPAVMELTQQEAE